MTTTVTCAEEAAAAAGAEEAAAAAGAENATLHEELGRLREDLEALEKRGELPDAMRAIRQRVDRIESRAAAARATGGSA